MSLHTFAFPTTITFGVGARHQLASILKEHGLERVLLVADRGVAGLPLCAELGEGLEAAGLSVAVYSAFGGNPIESHVTAGVEAARAHEAEAIVGLGGGCPLDVARAIALMLHHPGRLFDYEDGRADAPPVDQHIPFMVTIPTTAGTGSEVGRSTVISDDETHAKKIMFSPRLLADRVLADPALLVGLPAGVTAATGMDALTHNVEAYLARGYHPMADGIALEAVRLIAGSLERSVADGADLSARSDMLMASLMGAVAFQKGLGAVHSVAHALSTVADMHHGLANGIMLPFVMRYNAEAVGPRMGALAAAAGLESRTASAFIDWLVRLREAIGIPAGLTAAGVDRGRLDDLVAVANADVCHSLNPRPCTRATLRGIYEEAFDA